MTWITRIALKRMWLTLLVGALVAGGSVWALLTLKMELFPDIEFPVTTVLTAFPQAQPDEVVQQVTIPVESAAAGIGGLEHVTSISTAGSSVVVFQFEFGTNMDNANAIIAENLDSLILPPQVRGLAGTVPGLDENPRLFPIDINSMPVVILSLNGDIPVEDLKETALAQIVPRLHEIEGVFNVTVEGGAGDKVLISPSAERMTESGVSMAHIMAELTGQEYGSLEEVEQAVLRPDGLLLEQVASVRIGQAPGTSISRTNGRPSVSITVTKEAEANTVTTANAVVGEAEALGPDLPAGLELLVVMDQSDFIEASISDLTVNAIIGSALAVLVVFLFLMAFRASLVTAVSIPLSLLVGFLVMRFTNITINILTLSAMIIAVGRVIDNSIVILEVVYRRMQQGERFTDAAQKGIREVVTPITSATVATVVIFLPLAFVGGIVGEMFLPFGLTIIYALVGSLLLALTVVPALSGYLLKTKAEKAPRAAGYVRFYSATLRWCLNHRFATIIIAVVLFLGSFALLPIIGTSFIPAMDTNLLNIEIEMPAGTDLTAVKEVARMAEDVLNANRPAVVLFNTVAGSAGGGGGRMSGMFGGGRGSNYAAISVATDPDVDTELLAQKLARDLQGITETGIVTVTAQAAMAGGPTSGLEINVRGESQDDVVAAAEQLITALQATDPREADGAASGIRQARERARLRSLESLTDVELSVVETTPELTIQPDPQKMAAIGLSIEQMQRLQQEFFAMRQGASIAQASIDGAIRDVFVEGIVGSLSDVDTARRLLVGFPTAVPLGEIATVALGEQVQRVSRFDGKIAATVTAGISQENVGAVTSAVQATINSMQLAPGVEIDMGGISEDMRQSFSGMFVAIGIAMVLAYIVLVATFRSFRNPIIIMVSLPLASIGALLGLLASGRPLGISALMGILMLVGIVLTNAVVLIAVIQQMRRAGVDPYEAIVTGGQTRLRPILMTALTTMIAMMPLALGFGEGVLMGAELATVVVGGLFSSTLLTLLVIPVVYAIAYRIRRPGAIPVAAKK